jgi:rod shape-determining protein MreD
MIRTIVLSSLLLVLCNFIQSTWFGSIAILGVVPDLALIVLVWLSYENGIAEGPISGFLSGLAEDFISASPLGFHAFVKTATATAAALLHGTFFIDRLFLPIVLGIASTIFKALVTGLLSLLFGGAVHAYNFLDRMIWIEAAYNGIIAPLVFLLLTPLKRLLVTEMKRS